MFNKILKLYRFIFARKMFYKLNKALYQMSLRGLGVLNYESNKVSGESFLLKNLELGGGNKRAIIFDVGANIGNYSKEVLSLSSNLSVFAFEPHPLNYKKLLNNINYDNLHCFNVGVGDSNGEMSLYDYADNDGSSHASLYQEVIEEIHHGKSVEHKVKIIKLSDFVKEHGIDYIDLLKIDTEGNEMQILLGLKDFIAEGKVGAIHFEFNEMNVISRVFFKDYFDLLTNYDFYRLLPNSMLPIKRYTPIECEIFAYQNIVAIKK